MNIEKCRKLCLKLHQSVEETFPFDDVNLVMKIGGKMFALLPLDNPRLIILKCDPERAIELREVYQGIEPAFHFNKKHWNQIHFDSDVSDKLIEELVSHSFELVKLKLTKKERERYFNQS